MSSFTTYTQRNAIGAILELEALIAALDARVTVLEGAPLMAPLEADKVEEDNG